MHSLAIIAACVAGYLLTATFTSGEATGGIVLSIGGIYLAIVALIEDVRRDKNSQNVMRIFTNLSEMEWEVILAVRWGAHRISDIEYLLKTKLGVAQVEVFGSIASLMGRGYLISDEESGEYFLASVAVYGRREG